MAGGNFSGQADDSNIVQSDNAPLTTGAWARQSATGITFHQPGAGAEIRRVQEKLSDMVSVLDFGADPTGAADSTAAFNLATRAALLTTGNDDQPRSEIFVPEGKFRIDGTVFVRKGQHFRGCGLGSYIDLAHRPAQSTPAFRLGAGSWNATVEIDPNEIGTDPGGLGSSISQLWFHGARDGTGACVDGTRQAGIWIDHIFFTACGVGISLGGGDAIVTNCQFDLGLTGIVLQDCGNVTISNCNFYDSNYGARILSGCRDVEIVDCHFEYQHYSGIFLGDGGGSAFGSRGIAIRGNTFLQNLQHTSFTGFICLGCSKAEVEILGGNTFRNCHGAAIRETIGTGNKVTIIDALFDGKRTFAHPSFGYEQSTTMIGIDVSNMDVMLKSCVFRDLPGQPLVVGGSVVTRLDASDCTFTGSNGGTTDIGITNTVLGSRVDLSNIKGSGRLLFNPQVTVAVAAQGLKNWLNPPFMQGARRYVGFPYQAANIFDVSFKANAAPGTDASYRKANRYAVQVQQGHDGAVRTTSVSSVALLKAPATGGIGELDVEFGTGLVSGFSFFDDFKRADGPLGTSVSGHKWLLAFNPGGTTIRPAIIVDGKMTANPSGGVNSAAYPAVDLESNVTRMRARIAFDPVGSTTGGVHALIVTRAAPGSGNDYITDASIHIYWGAGGGNISFYDNGVQSGVMNLTYAAMAVDGTSCEVGFDLDGNNATFYNPDGTTQTLTDARFTSLIGHYATFEPFWNSNDHRPVFHWTMARGSGNSDRGLINANWPATYGNEGIDVQIIV